MKGRNLKPAIVLAALALSLFATSVASATPEPIKLRIEGATRTIFEGTVKTEGHAVTTQSGGTHPCDGTNHGANPTPGPTPTAALDTASAKAGFTWDGPWFGSFEDFGVARIAETEQTSSEFWGVLVNYQFTELGGCQQIVHPHEEVLWAFNAFEAAHLLKLKKGKRGSNTVRVTDGATGEPIEGATVGPINNGPGATTNARGEATVTFSSPGKHRVKAERADSIRSNAVVITTS
ncbi:MAG: peptidase associated/transthyretin-like domain-containing protein [Solirubrobacteraceae bacterium]